MKQTLAELEGEIDSCTIIVEDFITSLSIIDRPTIQKTSRGIEVL